MIAAGLRSVLVTDATLSAIIGSRVYPVRVPQDGSAPCIVYTLLSTEYTDGLDDEEQTGPDTERYGLDCWGEGPAGYAQAEQIASRVVTLLRTKRGLLGASGQRCKNVVVEDARDEEVVQDDGDDTHRYLRVVDVAIEFDPSQV